MKSKVSSRTVKVSLIIIGVLVLALLSFLLLCSCAGSGKLSASGECTFFVKGVPIEMVFVEGGTFMMGCSGRKNCFCSAEPAHEVTLSNFYIGKYTVTQKQWVAVMGIKSLDRIRITHRDDNLPMNNISWRDAQKFISRINLRTDRDFRLLTEAEWEYAARGGLRSNGYKYSGSDNIDDVAWYIGNRVSRNVYPVGGKLPNELGIYDMSGNVCEWVADWYARYCPLPKKNPKRKPTYNFSIRGPLFPQGLFSVPSAYGRVNRGGYHFSDPGWCSVYSRNATEPSFRRPSNGFRLAMNAPSKIPLKHVKMEEDL